MDYEAFYGLEREPFGDIPDPEFFYSGPEHIRAFYKLIHVARKGRGLGVLIGDVGTGKTTIARRILRELENSDGFEAGLLVLTHDEFDEISFLVRLSSLLGIEPSGSKTSILSSITAKLAENYQNGKRTVLMIDEANNLKNPEIMEEIRGLLNLELSSGRFVSFILSGMPSLLESLKQNASLYQRINTVVKLKPLSPASTREYIRHRIKTAGGNEEIFTETAYDLIYRFSQGRPRLINVICDNALLEGALMKKKPIDASVIETVVEELGLREG